MAFITKAPRRLVQPASLVVCSRGDKWYIDPEEERMWNMPKSMQYNSQMTVGGPSQEGHLTPGLDESNPYPRMPHFSSNLLNKNVKYDINSVKKNFGATIAWGQFHTDVHRGAWYQKNGVHKPSQMIKSIAVMLAIIIGLGYTINQLDRIFVLSSAAPKVLPFDQLYIEQGGRLDLPRDQRSIIYDIQEEHPYCAGP